MKIIDASVPMDQSRDFGCSVVSACGDGMGYLRTSFSDQIQTESMVRVYINGELTMTVTCSLDHIAELVLGRLFTEGMVLSVDEVEEIRICEHATRALVYLKDRQADLSRTHIASVSTCCTFNQMLNSYFVEDDSLHALTPIEWSLDDIFTLAEVFHSDTPMHKRTFGAHSCYIAHGSQVLYCCEDLGRHNAFDKVIGCALKDGIDLTECTVFTSGRVPTDMVMKAIRSGIPVLATKAVPTDLTIALAREYGLTFICSAHPDSVKVFSDPCGVVRAQASEASESLGSL